MRKSDFDLRILAVFLSFDLLLIAAHLFLGLSSVLGWSLPWPWFLHIGRDWSAGETMNYLKWLIVVYVCFVAYSRSKSPIYLGLAALFLVSLLDDSLQLHERGAEWIAKNFDLTNIVGDSSAHQVRELIIWAALGIVVLAPLVIGWVKSDISERRRCIPALMLFTGVVFFAVVVDVIHEAVFRGSNESSIYSGLLGVVEDGGEMIFVTLLASFMVGSFLKK